MLEVKTVSKKIIAEIAFSLTKSSKETFTISMGDGSSFHGELWYRYEFNDYVNGNQWGLFCQVNDDVQNLSGELSVNGEKETRIPNTTNHSIQSFLPKDLNPIEGKITITFEPSDKKMFETNLINYFNILTFKPGTTTHPNDIKLVVQEHEFEFNRACLAQISSAFREMFENCTSMEGNLPIPDESIQTFQTFKNILDGNSIGPQEITLDLFKFADKFNIQPLVKACGDYFAKKINKKNMFELAIIANRVEDGHLMKKLATLFISMTNDDATKDFVQNNPECFSKLMQSMFK